MNVTEQNACPLFYKHKVRQQGDCWVCECGYSVQTRQPIRDASCLDVGCDIDGKEPHKPSCDHAAESRQTVPSSELCPRCAHPRGFSQLCTHDFHSMSAAESGQCKHENIVGAGSGVSGCCRDCGEYVATADRGQKHE